MAAAAKVLRGGRSGSSTPFAAIGGRVPRAVLPQVVGSSSPTNLAATRPMHTGQWRSSKLMEAFTRISNAKAVDRGSHINFMAGKFSHVKGHFEPSDSAFVILRLHERLNVIEAYLSSIRRYWLCPLLTLIVGGTMISPMIMDYIRLRQIERKVCELRTSLAEAKVKAHAMGIALHDTSR